MVSNLSTNIIPMLSSTLVSIFSVVLFVSSALADANATETIVTETIVTETKTTDNLFSSNTVLDISLGADFENMCRERDDESCDYVDSNLSYRDADNALVVLPVQIKIRGGWRALKRNCTVPPLFVRFFEKETKGTAFEGQSMLPLTTHCHDTSRIEGGVRVPSVHFEQNVLKEYLAYNIYEQLTDISLRTRLVKIQYIGSNSRTKSRYAFFTEHFQALAKRANMIVLPRKVFSAELINLTAMDKVTLFNYMIGNLDWSIVRHRNVVLLGDENGGQIPVPYDFDMSGVVNAIYATPPPLLPVENVRERYFLGFCHPMYSPLTQAEKIGALESAILDQINNTPGFTKVTGNKATRYLTSFFQIAQTSSNDNNVFIKQCRPWPPLKDDKSLPERKRGLDRW